MTLNELKSALKAAPFRPFELHMSSGAIVRVRHPELVIMSPGMRTIGIALDEDRVQAVDLPMVERLTPIG